MPEVKLYLRRKTLLPTRSLGELYWETAFDCFTLEDKYRDLSTEKKVPGETAIPCGRYEVIINYSKRFKRRMPLLLNVPDFDGIRMHAGNTPEDTEGCPLLGRVLHQNQVYESKKAFDAFFEKLDKSIADGNTIFITVSNPNEKGVMAA